MHGIKFEVFKIIPEIRICGRISDHRKPAINQMKFYTCILNKLLILELDF